MKFKVDESPQKLRGGYYTPPDLAAFIARWVAAPGGSNILEPSCGDGVFLAALASTSTDSLRIRAFELDSTEARKAESRETPPNVTTSISASDFLGWAVAKLSAGAQPFDAVAGNPPYIRYQYLPKSFQHRAETIFRFLRCRFTKHTNAWVPFVLASLALLRPGGRLGMVLPAELIHVKHAQSLRSLLLTMCSRVVVIDPERLWFNGTLQGAVILLAEKKHHHDQRCEGLGIVPVTDREFVAEDPERLFYGTNTVNGRNVEGKWTSALLDADTRGLLNSTMDNPRVYRFGNIANVDVGIVTGANKFFLVSDKTVERFALHDYAYPMFGRSEHCPGIVYDERQHQENARSGKPTNFVWFTDQQVTRHRPVAEYIQRGEDENLHRRYKCRIRSPWFCVPSVYATDIGMLKRSHHAPRLVFNKARAFTTDTAYRISALAIDPRTLVTCFLNPLTALSAELEGRHYGGGVLELVPSEIERLMIPIPSTVDTDLRVLDQAVRTTTTEQVLSEYGQRILSSIGLSKAAQEQLLHGWLMLRNRRHRNNNRSSAITPQIRHSGT